MYGPRVSQTKKKELEDLKTRISTQPKENKLEEAKRLANKWLSEHLKKDQNEQ